MKPFLAAITLMTSFAAFSQNENVVKMRLDSVISEKNDFPYSKSTFFYDEQGNEIRWIDYYWNDTSNYWMEDYKNELIYDTNGNLIMQITSGKKDSKNRKIEYIPDTNKKLSKIIQYLWNDTTNKWEENNRWEYAYLYDSNKNLIMEVRDGGDYFGRKQKIESWYNSKGCKIKEIAYLEKENVREEYSKTEYLYDTNENLTKKINYNINIWVCLEKYPVIERKKKDCTWYKREYVYNMNGNLIKEIRYHEKKNTWKNYYKSEYIYNPNENLIKKICYNSEKNPCEHTSISEYVYDTNGNPIKTICYSRKRNTWKSSCKIEYDRNADTTKEITYHWEKNSWKGEQKKEYIYNNAGKEVMRIRWYHINNAWQMLFKDENRYDSNGNKTMQASYHYNPDNLDGEEKTDSKVEYIYDLSYSKENLIIPHSYNHLLIDNNNMLIEVKSYYHYFSDMDGTFMEDLYRTEKYYYSPQTK
jgi:hypothetical protein